METDARIANTETDIETIATSPEGFLNKHGLEEFITAQPTDFSPEDWAIGKYQEIHDAYDNSMEAIATLKVRIKSLRKEKLKNHLIKMKKLPIERTMYNDQIAELNKQIREYKVEIAAERKKIDEMYIACQEIGEEKLVNQIMETYSRIDLSFLQTTRKLRPEENQKIAFKYKVKDFSKNGNPWVKKPYEREVSQFINEFPRFCVYRLDKDATSVSAIFVDINATTETELPREVDCKQFRGVKDDAINEHLFPEIQNKRSGYISKKSCPATKVTFTSKYRVGDIPADAKKLIKEAEAEIPNGITYIIAEAEWTVGHKVSKEGIYLDPLIIRTKDKNAFFIGEFLATPIERSIVNSYIYPKKN
ncbi:MAG: hypothetical protein GXP63_03245 [DPANN group archaeon]|nr:hypothetical protein [DPANN group archaeon]